MRLTRLLASTAAVAATGLLGATDAHAAAPTVNYVALGDSYSSGVGTTDSYLDGCDRSTAAYPYLYAQATSPASFAFAACAGATTADVESSQLSTLSPATTLVSITIGGNDVGFSAVMQDCVFKDDSGCVSAVDGAKERVQNELPHRLDTLYTQIRSHAPNAHVVVLGYPQFYDLARSGSCPGLDTAKRVAINDGAALLDKQIAAEVVKHTSFTFVNTAPYFSGHEICDAAPWLHSLTLPTSSSYHPTADGHKNGYLSALESGV
ncbi:SGNH/GDSL hydrolase family protein [Streptomyces gilvus]|uniref:SGNH/GDSL hydrolase family protein n=1 Tax=Streptomyces gilvus TaxID=2920937 RepID=UPI001F0F2D70|nr:SGNH/GDSL hydrolase family protein [Streptomyces sp. CME 23]MCH5677885.1 SGNH/GDSL hydrolase family protein [Streptomyces sp. CME 23]